MSLSNIKKDVSLSEVEATETYQSLSYIQKSLTKTWNNVKAINHNLHVAKHKGLEYWLSNTQASAINKAIVTELFDNV